MKKNKKDLLISMPHAMHVRNILSSSFDFKRTSLIYGNFSKNISNKLKNKIKCDIKNFNFFHIAQSKLISMYSLLIDMEKDDSKNYFIKCMNKNYKSTDLQVKKTYWHKQENILNSFFLIVSKIFFFKFLLKIILIITSIIIYTPTIIRHRPNKILFVCTNTFLDKGLIFISKIYKIKLYGLINSWDHPSTKRFIHIQDYQKIFVWNDYMKKEINNIWKYPKKKIEVVGFLYFDSFFKYLKKKYTAKKDIIFFLPSPTMMDLKDQINVINFLINYCLKNKIKLLVKPHPGIDQAIIKKSLLSNKAIKWIKTKKISMNLNKTINERKFCDVELIKIINESRVIINCHSTTTLDAVYFLKPVINLCINKKYTWLYQWPYYRYILNSNAISLAESYNHLEILLNQYYLNDNIKKNNRKKLRDKYFGDYNPKSGKLISELIK